MRVYDEKEQAARRRAQEDQIRRIVREELAAALRVIGRSADYESRTQDREIEGRAAEAFKSVAEGAVQRLTCEHEFKDYQPDRCWRCDEPAPAPVNPFEGEPVRDIGRTRQCPLEPGVCPPLVGWSAFCVHVYEVHTEGDEAHRIETTDRILKGLRTNGAS
jgi:hypothetical protein